MRLMETAPEYFATLNSMTATPHCVIASNKTSGTMGLRWPWFWPYGTKKTTPNEGVVQLMEPGRTGSKNRHGPMGLLQ